MAESAQSTSMPRFPVLDGWRGISILMVLAAHQLPLGPNQWGLNHAAGLLGMSLFFTLSGFLITQSLMYRPVVGSFLIRRIFRIVPLAWLYLLIALPLTQPEPGVSFSPFLFYANNPGTDLTTWTGHFWSLCLEMQFYMVIAFLFGWLGKRSFALLPVMALAVTLLRVSYDVTDSIHTLFRLDEILAGACLALILEHYRSRKEGVAGLQRWVSQRMLPVWMGALLIVLLLSCHELGGPVRYLRPYAAASLVGLTILQGLAATRSGWVERILTHPWLGYVGQVSYAVYLIHPLAAYGWLGSGESAWVVYAKRPLVFALTFGLAHLSTFYYEQPWMKWGKAWSRSVERKQVVQSQVALLSSSPAGLAASNKSVAGSAKGGG